MNVRIYQINEELDAENALFMGYDFAENHGGAVSCLSVRQHPRREYGGASRESFET